MLARFDVALPPWLLDQQSKLDTYIEDLESRMKLVIELARSNVRHKTGGPFAAAVFESNSGRIVSLGVNRVVPASLSIAHAEIVALALAQQQLGSFDLGIASMPEHQLVVNGQPCAMCFGAIPWSGVRSVASGANSREIESITGFDEGPIHPQWQQELRRRGIEVIENLLSEQACDALREYAASGATIYNGRGGTSNDEIL